MFPFSIYIPSDDARAGPMVRSMFEALAFPTVQYARDEAWRIHERIRVMRLQLRLTLSREPPIAGTDVVARFSQEMYLKRWQRAREDCARIRAVRRQLRAAWARVHRMQAEQSNQSASVREVAA